MITNKYMLRAWLIGLIVFDIIMIYGMDFLKWLGI